MKSTLLAVAAAIVSATPLTAHAVELGSPYEASAAFYAALSTLDLSAMEEVWAKTGDATYVGPRSTTVTVGWDNVRAAWEASNSAFVSRTVELRESHMAINGDTAWEVGIETGVAQRIGETAATQIRNVTANVYQLIDGDWLMVSHVVHGVPLPPATPVAVR